MNPNWDDLRVFLALAREGTLTTAARSLGVSHPTVSRRVAVLERQIGARLFERLPDRFVPTSAGEKLAHIHQVLMLYLPPDAPGVAIVYCATQKRTEEIAQFLSAKGLTANCFHA